MSVLVPETDIKICRGRLKFHERTYYILNCFSISSINGRESLARIRDEYLGASARGGEVRMHRHLLVHHRQLAMGGRHLTRCNVIFDRG